MRALLVANGPSASQVDYSLVPRPAITVFAVNRVLGLVLPDYLCILDNNIEAQWIPEPGVVQGILTYEGCKFSKHPDALCHPLLKHTRACEAWPGPGQAFLNARNSACFCFQWIVEMGFQDIGIIGLEYSSRTIWEQHGKTAPTHWYGHNPITKRSPGVETGMEFWNLALETCYRRGITVRTLCPYPTPFDRTGIRSMGFAEWCQQSPLQEAPLPSIPGSFKVRPKPPRRHGSVRIRKIRRVR